MGYKLVCIDCRKALNRKLENVSIQSSCTTCGKAMIILPHRFRPPKMNETKKWNTIKFLIENGFLYQHIVEQFETTEYINRNEKYVEYPENLRDAKEFVKKYKDQALK